MAGDVGRCSAAFTSRFVRFGTAVTHYLLAVTFMCVRSQGSALNALSPHLGETAIHEERPSRLHRSPHGGPIPLSYRRLKHRLRHEQEDLTGGGTENRNDLRKYRMRLTRPAPAIPNRDREEQKDKWSQMINRSSCSRTNATRLRKSGCLAGTFQQQSAPFLQQLEQQTVNRTRQSNREVK
jgi:hypothetical protein